MTNIVIMMGILVGDPEIFIKAENKKYARFTLAVRREYKNAEGNYESDFINVGVTDRLADIVGEMTRKGSKVEVIGSLRTSSYTDKNDIRRKAFEIRATRVQLLDKKGAEPDEAFQPIPEDEEVPF